MNLTKSDLVDAIYKKHDELTKSEASHFIETFLKVVKDNLIDGSDLLLSGFGKFSVNEKRTRKGRNPATGETLILAARRVVTFRPSGKLRDRINT